MITIVLSMQLFIIFIVLGLIHFNWVFGGKWGFEIALPTKDNGKEFAEHISIGQNLQIDYFFAHPYHSWERGSNENLNGLILLTNNINLLGLAVYSPFLFLSK